MLDDKNVRRRFRASNYQVSYCVFVCVLRVCVYLVLSVPLFKCLLCPFFLFPPAVNHACQAFHLHDAHEAG